jgi:leucine-rich repeat-containing protein 49
MLTFQHNKISRIDNLVSLPNLLYLDLHDNLIKEIENITIPAIKVLMVARNQLTRIRGINELAKLEVLDLHMNKITKIDGFGVINSLRVLNLSSNQIVRMENLDMLVQLNELKL